MSDVRASAGAAAARPAKRPVRPLGSLLLDGVPLVVPGLVVGLLAVANGGFFPRSWAWSAAALAALAAFALFAGERARLGRLEVAALVAVA